MTRIRTFIAVDVDDDTRDRLVLLQERLAAHGGEAVKWVEPDSLHVTLLFLGEVEDRDLAAVCRTVSRVCAEHDAFTLAVEKVGCFPNARRPRVLWAGIGEGADELIALHAALEEPLLELGCYRREERQYTPHLTLGRVRPDKVPFALSEAIAKNQTWSAGQTAVGEVLVMSSDFMSGHVGPNYTVMGRAPLRGEA